MNISYFDSITWINHHIVMNVSRRCYGICGISFKSILSTQPMLLWNIRLEQNWPQAYLSPKQPKVNKDKLMSILLKSFVKFCFNFRDASTPLNCTIYMFLLNETMEEFIFCKVGDPTFPKHTTYDCFVDL